MSAAFTPGPWEVAFERAPTSRGFCRIVGSEAKPNRRNLIHVMGLYDDNKNVEADANARLTAAAPKLYEAGRGMLAFIDEHAPFLEDHPLTEELRAAIAEVCSEQTDGDDA